MRKRCGKFFGHKTYIFASRRIICAEWPVVSGFRNLAIKKDHNKLSLLMVFNFS